jgi:rubredoxin
LTTLRRRLIDWVLGRSSDGDNASNNSGHPAYRKCPKCGERDFRVNDRQMARPDVYGSRAYRLKWVCGACGNQESEVIEEGD